MLWQWANDPAVRQASFRTDPIPLAEHERWFKDKLADPSCFLFIAVDETGEPVGQIRFDAAGTEAELHVSVGRERRGRGLGVEMLRRGLAELHRVAEVRVVHAHVKPGNLPSIGIFEKVGFERAGEVMFSGQACHHFVWRFREDL